MKTKPMKIFLLFLILSLVFGTIFVSAVLYSQRGGMEFDGLAEYKTESVEMPLPLTYEATVLFPSDFSGSGGVIFGNYSDGKTPSFKLEVCEGGAPRIYIIDGDGTKYDVTFEGVNVYNGEKTHIAIALDSGAGAWVCYINGAVAKTVSAAVPATFNMTSVFALGCDISAGQKPFAAPPYFKGELFGLSLYKDTRAAEEIALDAAGGTTDTSDLITAYAPLSQENEKASITAIADNKYNLTYSCDWIKDLSEPEDYAYSFAVIGDIQSMTYYYPELLIQQFEWIRDNAEEKKIAFSVGLGDITETNTKAEYLKVIEAYDKIDGIVPFSIIRGNHERTSSNDTTMYDTYITQDRYGDEITGSLDGTMHNTYRIIQIGKVKYMFMNLDLVLSDEAIEWANGIISEHPECHVIVSTHAYKNMSGTYLTLATKGQFGVQNDSEVLWDRLLSQHENIVMMLYGHSPKDTIYYKQREGVHGNKVTEMLINPSEADKRWGGCGFVAMLYFSEDGEQVGVQYYSTIKDAYHKAYKEQYEFTLELDTPGVVEFSDVIMNVGADETERNLTWYTQHDTVGEVQYAKAVDGTFPSSYSVAKATAVKAAKSGYYSYKATMVGLEANSTYIYRLVVGDVVSDCYTFKTYAMGDDFSFAFITDPQVKQASHALLWDDTLNKIKTQFGDISIVVSGGDQTQDPASEDNFSWFISKHLSSLAIATTVGPPHDNTQLYKDHYNLPNLSSKYGISTPSSDYFYTYNNVLFMHLNVENKDYDGHIRFMENAIADNPDCLFRVVTLHFSFFSGGNHSTDGSVLAFREALGGKFSEFGIDVVLSGHDHVYSRSQMMINGNTVSADVVKNGSVTDPEGTLYICGTSATGSGWYSVEHHDDDAYIALSEDSNRKSVVIFTVSEGSLTLKSYFIDGNAPEEFDSFTINKTKATVRLNGDTEMLEILDGTSRIPLVNAYAYSSAIVKVVGGYWSVSTDGGVSFNSLGVASTDTRHVLRINPTTGYWELSEDGGTSFESLGISTKTYTVKFVKIPGAVFGDATDLSAFSSRRFTATTPDAPMLYMPKGSMSEGNLYDWAWEYYLVGGDGTPVSSFSYGESYIAYPVRSATPVASTIYISTESTPEEYTYTWAEAWNIVSLCVGEKITLVLKNDITLTAGDAISIVIPVDLTLDLGGKRLDTSALAPAIKFAVGSNGSTFTVVTTTEGGVLNAGTNDFIEIGSNQGSRITIQYGSPTTAPLTVESVQYLVGANGNFKYTSTLNLGVYGGSYTVTKGVIYVSNVKANASYNIYKLDLVNAAFNFLGSESAIVRAKSNGVGFYAAEASYINADGCVFTDTYKANHTSSRFLIRENIWYGTATFTDCDFVGMSIGADYQGNALTSPSLITIGSGCTFTNSKKTFKATNPLSFFSEKVVTASGTVIARTDAVGGVEILPISEAAEITWANPVGYTEYWKLGVVPTYLGDSSFTVGDKTYSLVLAETPTAASGNKEYSFKSAEGYLYRYDSTNGVWQISTDGGDTYTDITEGGGATNPDPEPTSGCTVTVGGVSTSYPADTDFREVLSAYNLSSYAGKEVNITLGADMTIGSTITFNKSAILKIDLAGHKLTVAAGGALKFSSGYTLQIYSSVAGAELVFASTSDGIQPGSGTTIFGSEDYKNTLTITSPREMINCSMVADGATIRFKYLGVTLNSAAYGILRLNAIGAGAVTVECDIVGCTVNGSAAVVLYNASTTLNATKNGGVFTTDSYISVKDSTFTSSAASPVGFFGSGNFTDRYFGTASFTGCTFNNYTINGDLIYSDEALSYNTYFDTLAGTGYDPTKAITVGKGCVFYNYGDTFTSDMSGFSASNVSLASGCEISVAADHVEIVSDDFCCRVEVDGAATYYPGGTDFKDILDALNKAENAGKEINITLGADMSLDSTYRFANAAGAILNIDLAGNKLTLKSGGRLRFGAGFTVRIYSSVEGAELVFNTKDDGIQLDTGGLFVLGSDTYKGTLTVTAVGEMLNVAQLADGSRLTVKYLYSTINSGSNGILRLNAKGDGAVTLEAEIIGCTINGSASVVYYNSSSSLSATANGGVFTVDSYISAKDSRFTSSAASPVGFFGNANLTDRYFGTVSFIGCTFDNYTINGNLIYSDEALSYNTYFDTLAGTGYDPTKAITVGKGCVFYNYGDTFTSDMSGFSANNTSLASGALIAYTSNSALILDASEHILSGWLSEHGQHWKECTSCNDGVKLNLAECDIDDSVCTVCGASQGVPTPPPHEHSYDSVVTPPTCTERGYTTHTCGGCSDSYVDTYVPEQGHIDEDTDHECDRECGKTDMGTHADGADGNHLCDYGCGIAADEGCYDTDPRDGRCDECECQMDTGDGEPDDGPTTPDTEPDDDPTTPDTEPDDDPTAPDTEPPKEDNGGLGTGAIVGIALGSVLGVGGGGFLALWFIFRRKKII